MLFDMSHVFEKFPDIETERCLLRAVKLDDASAIFHIMSDPETMRYFGRPPMTSFDEAVEKVDTIIKDFEDENGITWIIVNRANNKVMGDCCFWRLQKPHFRAEIGYILGSAWWRQGFMREVASSVLNYGFAEMGLHSVEANIDPENIASRRLLESLSFSQEGYFHDNYYDRNINQFTDTAVFSLLESTWRNRGKSGFAP